MNFKSLSELWHQSLDSIYGADEVSALLDIVLHHYTGVDKARLRISRESFSADNLEDIEIARQRLSNQEPVQYILGETEFYGLHLKVNPSVLIPRPETEELVGWILSDNSSDTLKAIDFCSGSGCIALALKANRPAWEVSGLELSKGALELSKENAQRLNLAVEFSAEDIFQADLKTEYDIMVSNPPYVRLAEKAKMHANVLQHEPEMALFVADEDPFLFYRRIASLAVDHLKPEGWLYLEINEYLSEELMALLSSLGFTVELRKDAYLKNRMLRCQKKFN